MPFWNNKIREEGTPAENGKGSPVQQAPQSQMTQQREEPSSMAMLKREELPMGVTGSGELNALLGKGSEFEGKLTFEGTVRIDGKFNGTIITNDVLVVGEGARINAEISCGTIVVHGEVIGNIRAKTAVELHHPAKVKGNIETSSLMVEKGVVFEGQSKMENLEKGGGAKAGSQPQTVSPSATAAKA
jgi:cytoskeletal protein CcmA (bactofilin family)